MSEQESEGQREPAAEDGAAEGTKTTGADAGIGPLDPAEDADGHPDAPDAGHVSSVTDLPEGVEVDPLTDAGPSAVVDADEHDG